MDTTRPTWIHWTAAAAVPTGILTLEALPLPAAIAVGAAAAITITAATLRTHRARRVRR